MPNKVVKGGSLISHERGIGKGTLGCLVRKNGDGENIYLLTAAHVIALHGMASKGDAIYYHPPKSDTANSQPVKIAEYDDFRYLKNHNNKYICDAAIAKVTSPDLVSAEIKKIGLPKSVGSTYERKDVQFFGAGSKDLEKGEVLSINQPVPITYRAVGNESETFTLNYAEQVFYRPRGQLHVGGKVSTGGDSGAIVLDEYNFVLGLHIGATPQNTASVYTPIEIILKELGLELILNDSEFNDGGSISTSAANLKSSTILSDRNTRCPQYHWLDKINKRSIGHLETPIRALFEPHSFVATGIQWHMSVDGIIVGDGRLPRSPGKLITVPRIWNDYGEFIKKWAEEYKVPIELIIATICTESSGKADATRTEPGWRSDKDSPDRVSIGLMQTLISTARATLKDDQIDRDWLLYPENSIKAGTAYINEQRTKTQFDPPKVACAYNAGGLYLNNGANNHWKMRQYPLGTGHHADRFIMWFNDCFAFFRDQLEIPWESFYALIHEETSPVDE